MKANLIVAIELPYMVTEYDILKEIAVNHISIGHSKSLWFFRSKHLPLVIKTLGKSIEIEEKDIKEIEPYAPTLKKTLESKARKKGQGKFEVCFRSPKLYIIKTIIDSKESKIKIPTENIKALWNVIKRQQMYKAIKTSTVAENLMKELEIDRFNRSESNSFDFEKFQGTRNCLFRYLYYPLKVLQADGVIIHHTSGLVERTSDDWELQTTMQEE